MLVWMLLGVLAGSGVLPVVCWTIYPPSLVAFSLVGMDPRAAFPIMMGSGAFVATIAGVRFVGAGRFHWRAVLGLTAAGIPGVLVAVWLVTSLERATP